MIFDLDAWSATDSSSGSSPRSQAGINEFIAFWPTEEQRPLFERAVTELIPALRTRST